jgi:NADPH-dependent curcumin reductase CurA
LGWVVRYLVQQVIGSCGGAEKCALIRSKFGFDHAIDYKTCQSTRIPQYLSKEIM